jgi:hypothetical protein
MRPVAIANFARDPDPDIVIPLVEACGSGYMIRPDYREFCHEFIESQAVAEIIFNFYQLVRLRID